MVFCTSGWGTAATLAIPLTTHRTCSRCWERCFASGWILPSPEACSTRFRRTIPLWAVADRLRSLPTVCATPGAFPWSAAAVASSSPTLARPALKKLTYCRRAATTAGASWRARTASTHRHRLRHQQQDPADCRIPSHDWHRRHRRIRLQRHRHPQPGEQIHLWRSHRQDIQPDRSAGQYLHSCRPAHHQSHDLVSRPGRRRRIVRTGLRRRHHPETGFPVRGWVWVPHPSRSLRRVGAVGSDHVGTAALGCPGEQGSPVPCQTKSRGAALRRTAKAAVPTWPGNF